jgi:hypothetical protein
MGSPSIQVEVLSLVRQAVLPPEGTLPAGASSEALDAFSRTYPLRLPKELEEWLLHYNGPLIGPGGLYGIQTERKWDDIGAIYTLHPEWLDAGWIPVAGDGCGNHYVLDTTVTLGDMHPIYFVDHEQGYDHADYIVASNLWSFLRFLLANDARKDPLFARWPFDKPFVLAEDPALGDYAGPVPLPWEA